MLRVVNIYLIAAIGLDGVPQRRKLIREMRAHWSFKEPDRNQQRQHMLTSSQTDSTGDGGKNVDYQ